MSDKTQRTLVKLSDPDPTVEPAEDIRGRRVVDRSGNEVGDVDDLMVDEQETHARFSRSVRADSSGSVSRSGWSRWTPSPYR